MTFTLWFMGRPAAGKSTIAKRVESYLSEQGHEVENLDGDEIRQSLHPDLGFTREDRAINNRRTAYICKILNRNRISAVTGMITPFRDAQRRAREIVTQEGEFTLIYVKCSVKEAERRDPKNLYEQAQEGNIENFTGINHPFEEPHTPDIVIDSENDSIDKCVEHVVNRLHEDGTLNETPRGEYNFDLTRDEERAIQDRLESLGYLDDR